jgi:hypothetical protein
MFDFDYYLNKAIQIEPINEEENSTDNPLFTDNEEFEKKRKILVGWMKNLNNKFKPYAIFKIIINENDKNEKDLFLSLKAKGEQMNDFFYHVTPTTKLTKDEYDKVLKLAEEEIKALTLTANYN